MWHSWLLRESTRVRGADVDLRAVLNSAVDPLIPRGEQILRFVDAAVLADTDELPDARARLLAHGDVDTVKAVAGVVAVFQIMNRLVDAIGIPLPTGRFDDFIADLGVSVPDHAFDHSRS